MALMTLSSLYSVMRPLWARDCDVCVSVLRCFSDQAVTEGRRRQKDKEAAGYGQHFGHGETEQHLGGIAAGFPDFEHPGPPLAGCKPARQAGVKGAAAFDPVAF